MFLLFKYHDIGYMLSFTNCYGAALISSLS